MMMFSVLKLSSRVFVQRGFSSTAGSNQSLSEAIKGMASKFEAGGVPEPLTSAKHLAAGVIGTKSLDHVDRAGDTPLDPAAVAKLDVFTQCRLARMPVQYILKEWDFCDLTLMMQPPVFIPRPETEELVQLVKDHLNGLEQPKVLEIGCGSGAISLSLLKSLPNLGVVTAVDMFSEACVLTMENAVANGLADRIDVKHAKLAPDGELKAKDLDGLAGEGVAWDVIVSNPPYVPRKDLMELYPEIRLYEDLRALDGGKDGLSLILPLLNFGTKYLKPGGKMFIEVDPCHAYLLPQILPEKKEIKLNMQHVVKDFGDKERFIVFQKPEI